MTCRCLELIPATYPWILHGIGHDNIIQGCALRKTKGSPLVWTCEIQGTHHMISVKKLSFSSSLGAKVRPRDHRALLEHSLVISQFPEVDIERRNFSQVKAHNLLTVKINSMVRWQISLPPLSQINRFNNPRDLVHKCYGTSDVIKNFDIPDLFPWHRHVF